MSLLLFIIDLAFKIANFIIIAQVAISWLTIFGVINTNHPQAKQVVNALDRITGPIYAKINKFLPPIAGLDLSPIVLLFGLSILRAIIFSILI